MTRRIRAAILALALTAVTTPAQATGNGATADDRAATITELTTENSSGGLTPYIPLATHLAVSFTDATPSDHGLYRIRVAGFGVFESVYEPPVAGTFHALIWSDGMVHGESYDVTVEELDADGNVVSSSETAPWTFRFVKHPRYLATSSRRVDGIWSYVAGRTARFDFRGSWERGTRFSTQVWVSKRKRFTAKDWTRNHRGAALVGRYDARRPVLSVRLPRRPDFGYVHVSVLGWKDGKAGWVYQVPAERVIRR